MNTTPTPSNNEKKGCQKTIYSSTTSKMLYSITFVIIIMLLYTSEKLRIFLLNKNVLLVPVAIVILLHLIYYYQNPVRLTASEKCKLVPWEKIRCDYSNAISATISLIFYCSTLFLLLSNFIQDNVIKFIICFIIFAIGSIFIWTVYNSDSIYEESKFSLLPKSMVCKNTRIAISFIIVFLNIIILYQGYIIKKETIKFVDKNIVFILGIVTAVITIILSYLSLDETINYSPENYDLPIKLQTVQKYKQQQRKEAEIIMKLSQQQKI